MKRLSRVSSGSPKLVPEKDVPQQTPKTLIEGRSVDEGRPLRVVVIGAGISGILSCIRFVQRIPNIDLCIYDKNADIGGTWVEVSFSLWALGNYISRTFHDPRRYLQSLTDGCCL
jgi:hypothetical protein